MATIKREISADELVENSVEFLELTRENMQPITPICIKIDTTLNITANINFIVEPRFLKNIFTSFYVTKS